MSKKQKYVKLAYRFNPDRLIEILHGSFTRAQSRMVKVLAKRAEDLHYRAIEKQSNLRLQEIEDAKRDALYVHDHDPEANDHLLAQASASKAFSYLSINETTKETIRVIGVLSADLNRWLKAFDSDTIEGVTLLLKETSFLEELDGERDLDEECHKKLIFIDKFQKQKEENYLIPSLEFKVLRNQVRGFYRRLKQLRFKRQRNKADLEFLRAKLSSEAGSSQQRSKWEADFRRIISLTRKSALLAYGESASITDEDHAMIAASALARGFAKVENSHDTYGWKSTVKLHASNTHKEGTLAVNYDDYQRGESESIISILAECFNDPSLIHQVKGLDLKIEDDQAWSILATTCREQGLIPAANNGSKALLKLVDKGELSKLAILLDCMASNMSEAFVYLLGLINGSGENKLGVKDDISEPLTGKDKNGRSIIAVVYESNTCGLLVDPDGSGVTNFIDEENIGQTRFWAVDEDSGYGLFAKGENANARFTVFTNEKTGQLEMFKITDLVNLEGMTLGQLQSRGYTKLEQETLSLVNDMWELQDHDPALFDKMVYKNHVIYKGKNQLDRVDQQIKAWEAWFDARKDAPWVIGLEIGQVKCKAKNHFDKVAKVNQASLKSAMKATAHGIAELSLDLYGVIIIKSPSWKISSTSLNFQPMALMLSNKEMGEDIEEFYRRYSIESNAMLDGFGSESLRSEQSDRWQKFVNALKLQADIADWPGALRENFQAKLWRWFTNFNKTDMPTRRVLMHAMKYRGIGIVDDSFCYKELARQCASWRGPLISYMALQAPVFVSLKSAIKLKAYIESEDFGKDNELHQYYTLFKERILFKNKLNSITDRELVKFLDEIIRIATIFNVTDALTLMHTKDIEDMQGDDDGDTVVVDPDPSIVAKFIFTEKWWVQFLEKNDIKPLELEQPKSSQIEFRIGCRYLVDVAAGGEVTPLTDEERNAIDNYGLYAPKLAKKFGFTGDKIPNPLGLTFAEFFNINKAMDNVFTSDDDSFGIICKKLGTSTAGPIGPPSNCAPDLLIKALANVNEEGKLDDNGLFLFEGYKNMSSQVQISIDFGKRIVDIINSFLFNSSRFNDNGDAVEYPRFYEQIKPEVIKPFLAKNNPNEVYVVRIIENSLGGQCNILRFVEDKNGPGLANFTSEQDFWNKLVALDSKELHCADSNILAYLVGEPFKKVASPCGKYSVKVKVVTVKDPDNYCFDFNSIYDYAGYVLECVYPEMKPSVWKDSLTNLLSDELRPDVQKSLNASANESALVEHTTTFFKWYDNQPKVKQLMDVAPNFVAFAKQSDIGKDIDVLYPQVNIATAAFFSEEYEMTKGRPSPSKIMNAAMRAYGFDMLDIEKLLNQKGVEVMSLAEYDKEGVQTKKVCVNLLDIIVSCARHDETYLDPKVVQSLWQILIDAYLKNEPENEFTKSLVDFTCASFKELTSSLIETKLTSQPSIKPKSIASSPDLYMRDLQEKNDPLFSELLSKGYILEKEGTNRKYYKWKDRRSVFAALELITADAKTKCITAIKARVEAESSAMFGYATSLVEGDAFDGAMTIISAMKGSFVEFDNTIRYFNALSRMKFLPFNHYVNGRYSHLNGPKAAAIPWSDKDNLSTVNSGFTGYSKQMIAHPVNLYASMLDPLTVLKVLHENGVRMSMQDDRLAQWKTIKAIANRGHYIKSYSFFNNSGWKCQFTVSLLDLIVGCKEDCSGVSIRFEAGKRSEIFYEKNKSFHKQVSLVRLLNLIGLREETFNPVLNARSENGNSYYHGWENIFSTAKVNDKRVLVWKNAPCSYITHDNYEVISNAMKANLPSKSGFTNQLYMDTNNLYHLYRHACMSSDGEALANKLKGFNVPVKINNKGTTASFMGYSWRLDDNLSFLTSKLLKLIALAQ